MKNLILVFYLFHYNFTVLCLFLASNTSDPALRQLKALEHVHTFLVEVQQEIKESRDLLKHLKNSVSFHQTTKTPPKMLPGNTLVRDVWRYLSATVPQRLLRTNSESIGSTSASPTIASVAMVPGAQQQTQMSFLQVHDYVVPDFAPNYRDIFAPEPERQGVANETYLIPNTWSTTNSETVATYNPTSGVPQTADELQILYTQTTKGISVGDILQGLVVKTTTPDPHPMLHKQLVRDSTGYFSVGVENLLMLVVTKEPEHVKPVLEPTYAVVDNLEAHDVRANLHWLEHPMSDILHSVIAMMAPGVIDFQVIQVKANLLWMLLKNRRTLLGDEVNGILDFADGMVKEEDGERIFDRLDDFLHFPNVSTDFLNPQYKTGRDLCEGLIKAFNYPFSDYSVDRQRLVNSANAALIDHFGEASLIHRRAGFSNWLSKLDSWLASKFTQKLTKLRASRVSTIHRKNTPQRTVHKHNKWTSTSSQLIYNRARSIGKFRNSEFLKQLSNPNRRLTYKFGTTKKGFSKRFQHDTKKLTAQSEWNRALDNPEDIEQSYKYKNKRKHRRVKQVTKNQKADQRHDNKPQTLSKWITSHIDSYNVHRLSTNFRRKSNTTQRNDLEEYPKQLKSSQKNINSAVTSSKPRIKDIANTDSAESQLGDTIDSDNSKTSSTYSDEKEILDVNLLNHLLNVTAEESSENNKPLNISIETDDDVEILTHLKQVLYDK